MGNKRLFDLDNLIPNFLFSPFMHFVRILLTLNLCCKLALLFFVVVNNVTCDELF